MYHRGLKHLRAQVKMLYVNMAFNNSVKVLYISILSIN